MGLFQKVMLALSCFLPLFLIFCVGNIIGIVDGCKSMRNFYCSMLAVWIICTLLGAIGIIIFIKKFLGNKNKAKRKVKIISAKNLTAEYFFTYFSLFVLTFFTVEPSEKYDVFILIAVMILMLIVYIRNDMYFINPVLNIIGYKAFSIEYEDPAEEKNANHNSTVEIKVFSKDDLAANIGKNFFVSYSKHDFTICYKLDDKIN